MTFDHFLLVHKAGPPVVWWVMAAPADHTNYPNSWTVDKAVEIMTLCMN